jgi:hypothetical protein
MALRAEATGIGRRSQLPTLPTYHEESIEFSPEDVEKIIEQIVTKGSKYGQFKKTLTSEQAIAFPEKLQSSCFVVDLLLFRRLSSERS